MNEKNLIIKERNNTLLSKGIVFLLLATFSLLIALMPYLSDDAKIIATVFYIVGGISFVVFATLFVFLLYKEYNPNDALIITSRGFTDTKNVGADIEIEWTNVSSVKLLGKREAPYLGITLENSDIVLARMKKKEADEMRENINENLPNILISQNEIRASVKELKDIFVKFIREARILSNDSANKPKSNPFSTDDVLRVFGKLPKEEQAKPSTEEDNNPIINGEVQNAPKVNQTSSVQSDDEHIDSAPASSVDTQNDSNDSFYETLQRQAQQTKAAENTSDSSELPIIDIPSDTEKPADSDEFSDENEVDLSDDMPDEMKELLSRAKSKKITEIEKILSEKNVSFKIPDENDNSASDASEDSESSNESEMDLSTVFADEHSESESDDADFEIRFEEIDESPEEADDNASSSERCEKRDDKTDTKEFYPDLVIISDGFNESAKDDDDFIIPKPIEYEENDEEDE